MLERINLNIKLIKLIKLKNKLNPYNEEIKNLKLEIYSMLLGYYSAQKDKDIFNLVNNDELLLNLENKINNIFGKNIKIVSLNNGNIRENFKRKMFKSDCEQQIEYQSIFKNFIYGYSFYENYKNENDSILDYLMGKYKRLENKFIKIQHKVDTI